MRSRLHEMLPEPLADVLERERQERHRVAVALANLDDGEQD